MADLVLMDKKIPDTELERIQDIKLSGESLLDIINEILDISKIEANRLELEQIEFSLRDILQKVIRLLSVKIFQDKLEFICDIDPEIPDVLVGDPIRIRQILINLVGNAIKFTDKGNVTISVKQLKTTSNTISLNFSIEDTGIGIPEEKIKDLFKSFSQVDSSTTRKHGGTGLGLSISKKLVTMMGGEIKVKSELGKGSSFSFTLKLKLGKQSESLLNTQLKIKSDDTILVVDDNKKSTEIISRLLKYYKINHEIASSFKEAQKKIKESINAKRNINLFLIDYFMPEMNGLEMGNSLNKDFSEGEKAEIIVMTPVQYFLDGNKLKNTNFKYQISKPILQKDLRFLLAELLEKKDTTEAGLVSTTKNKESIKETKQLSILVAEDQAINQKNHPSIFKQKRLQGNYCRKWEDCF